jgi:hypothetical protein
MNFTPKTEQEIIDAKLWKKGEYEFEIADGAEKQSKAGHPMIELKLKLSDGNGKNRSLTDYLLAETPEKLRHCCSALGLLQKYETGILAADDFVGGRGKLRLGIEKDKKHVYPDKNVVLDYICSESAKAGAGSASTGYGLKF